MNIPIHRYDKAVTIVIRFHTDITVDSVDSVSRVEDKDEDEDKTVEVETLRLYSRRLVDSPFFSFAMLLLGTIDNFITYSIVVYKCNCIGIW